MERGEKKMNYFNIRYCKQCKGAYDIDTHKDLCPSCRKKQGGNEKCKVNNF